MSCNGTNLRNTRPPTFNLQPAYNLHSKNTWRHADMNFEVFESYARYCYCHTLSSEIFCYEIARVWSSRNISLAFSACGLA